MENVIETLEQLSEKDEETLDALIEKDRETYYRLLMAMGALCTKICGNPNKLYEKTTQLSLLINKEATDVEHVKHSYGADLRIKDKDTNLFVDEEIKSSVVKKKDHYKSNWVFSIASDSTLESLSLKYNGTVRFVAIHGTQVFKTYVLSSSFVNLYFIKCLERYQKGRSKPIIINLGCIYSSKEEDYPRLSKYVRYDKILKERGMLSSDEWHDVMKRVTVRH